MYSYWQKEVNNVVFLFSVYDTKQKFVTSASSVGDIFRQTFWKTGYDDSLTIRDLIV
jgi:hypothetical protein